MSGIYTLQSNSNMKMYGYLYERYFNPYNPSENLFSENEGDDRDNQIKITAYFQANITYVLVVTTSINDKNVEGAFSVTVSGADRINMKRIGMFLYFLVKYI